MPKPSGENGLSVNSVKPPPYHLQYYKCFHLIKFIKVYVFLLLLLFFEIQR